MPFLPACLLISALVAPFNHDPSQAEELRVRAGLPNVMAKLAAGAEVRVAYVGGSITAANGWRPKTTAWLRTQWPAATITEINAAISGTGSDYSACRLATDVLPQQPDLVFLECRVNGGGGYEHPSVEGLVRQVWTANPQTDICFVYTIGEWMVPDLAAGRAPWFSPIMETIANAYGVPSIDLGIDVARRVTAGEWVFRAPTFEGEQPVFSTDGVHPGDAGHELYREVIARAFVAMSADREPTVHTLPAPLVDQPWVQGELVPVEAQQRSAGWQPVDLETDETYRSDFGRTHAMLRGAARCDQAGETITVDFDGVTIGFSDIPYDTPVVVEVSIDGGAPLRIERPQTEAARRFARFFYLPAQAPGRHRAVLRVAELPAGQSYYVGQVLVIG